MDMTTKEINKRLDEADKKLFKAQELVLEAKNALYEVRVAKELEVQQTKPAAWISVTERMPADDQRVPVRTTAGATYFLHPIGGKFPAEVKEWYELPE